MRRRFPILAFLAVGFTFGGLLIPQIGFSALPPQQVGVSVTLEFGGGGIFPYPFLPPPLGTFVLRGFAPPDSFLTVLKNKAVGATARTGREGTFEVRFTNVSANTYELGFFIEDAEGNVSQTVVLPGVPVFRDAETTIENILIPPTFVLDTPDVGEGDDVLLHGFSVPRASVIAFVGLRNLVKRVESKENGYWKISFPANELSKGEYAVRVNTQLQSGLLSMFSESRTLRVAMPPGSLPQFPPSLPPSPPFPPEGMRRVDLNKDGRVDLVDLSILLYNWGTPKDSRADFNRDGIVDLVDFSIMLFWWTG